MALGRPPGITLDPDQEGRAAVELAAAEVDDTGHLTIPVRVASAVGWLNSSASQNVLAVLPKIGIVELHPWDPSGLELVKKKRELETRIQTDASARSALTSLVVRYRRLVIRKHFETTLSLDLRLHLGLQGSSRGGIYAMSSGERLQLLAKDVVDSMLGEEHNDLTSLP